MLGKAVTRVFRLDYTEVSEPLTVDAILKDITGLRCRHCAEPEVLVMWEHQWDWLVKQVPALNPPVSVVSYIYRVPEADAANIRTLWGVPVEVRQS